jgi:hypothetical protein
MMKAQGRPNLPLAFPCTLAMIRKVATWSLLGWEYVHGNQLG